MKKAIVLLCAAISVIASCWLFGYARDGADGVSAKKGYRLLRSVRYADGGAYVKLYRLYPNGKKVVEREAFCDVASNENYTIFKQPF